MRTAFRAYNVRMNTYKHAQAEFDLNIQDSCFKLKGGLEQTYIDIYDRIYIYMRIYNIKSTMHCTTYKRHYVFFTYSIHVIFVL